MNVVTHTQKWGKWGSVAKDSSKRSPLLPPGWAIGMIWLVLFGLLGNVFYENRNVVVVCAALLLLFIYSLLYPVYTNGLQQTRVAKVANTTTLIMVSVVTILVLFIGVKRSALYLLPWLAWASYVNISDALAM